MRDTRPTIAEQEAAWFEFIEARRKADEAYRRFEDLYLAEDRLAGRIVERKARNVLIFPVHRTRAISIIPDGAA